MQVTLSLEDKVRGELLLTWCPALSPAMLLPRKKGTARFPLRCHKRSSLDCDISTAGRVLSLRSCLLAQARECALIDVMADEVKFSVTMKAREEHPGQCGLASRALRVTLNPAHQSRAV